MINSRWNFKSGSLAALMIVASILVFSLAVMFLWNWLIPALFSAGTITFLQAVGILVLCRLLFGWKMPNSRNIGTGVQNSRWNTMSPEERRSFAHQIHERHRMYHKLQDEEQEKSRGGRNGQGRNRQGRNRQDGSSAE
ncbi:MAG: hypothetical protein LKI53_00925 [Bacteroidales bacterium]|jgi:predicted Fe-S protein YdhL (DUF1289 family)|nr:hypothetical protein [Bacteroidales bacterium]